MPKPKGRDMSHPLVAWSTKHGFQAFGDRLNFLSPERAQLQGGRLRILPPLHPERRTKD